jgi:hypothetical protein
MAEINAYARGATVRASVLIENAAGTDVDPTGLSVVTRNPAGTETTKVYGTDVEVVKAATGSYYIDIDLTTVGEWAYRWIGTGTNKGAGWKRMRVLDDPFA